MNNPENILRKIREEANSLGKINIMEVCGTHTQTIAEYGIREALPKNINLISGPGCPVCVTSQRDIDNMIELASSGIKVATYGDMLRVPGSRMRLDEARTGDDNIKVIYSVNEIIGKDYVFFGTGFETTTPMTAFALENKVMTYSVHKLIIPALRAISSSDEINIHGFIDPGHVSVIIGCDPYKNIDIPQVISGFERDDVLKSILMLLSQINEGRCEVENEYERAVETRGNVDALRAIDDNFKIVDSEWRGFGMIPKSGLSPRDKNLDARVVYKSILDNVPEPTYPKGCICDRIIKGISTSFECLLFNSGRCTPENPIGPCMVSVEGSCNVWFRNKK